MIEARKIYRMTIDGYAADGSGVARHEGAVVFVKGAVGGEVCDVLVEKVGRSAVWGRVALVVEPSPARRKSDCPYDRNCGGCTFRHMDYEEELRAKGRKVEDALRRIGGTEVPLSAVHGAERTDRYRNKAQFPVAPGPKIGFYQARTHAVTDVEDCLLQPTAAASLRAAAKAWMKTQRAMAYDEKTGQGLVRHVYVRTNRAGQSLFCLLINGKRAPEEGLLVDMLRTAEPNLVGVVLGINLKKNNVILGEDYRTLWGDDFLMDEMCGFSFRLSVPSFYQVNRDQAEVLYGRALEFAGLTGSETVLDLYCGIGTISLALSRRAGKVYGAEVVPQAIEDARANAARNGVSNVEFLCADAGEAARRLAQAGVTPQVVCVDPPRKGLAPDVVDTIAAMDPRRVVYVSCDSGTLARDIKRFAAHGYAVRRAEAVDLFPRTAHVETVCLLTRTPY